MKRYVSILLGIVLTLLVSASIRAAEVTYYHTDAMGTPLAISDAQGKVVWKGDYLPFGEEHDIVSNPEQNKRRFVGKEKDEESGLHYFGARYMDEKSGRFISPDPVYAVDPATSRTNTALLANPLRLNRYVYGLNNPYRYVDPDGRDPGSLATGDTEEVTRCHVNPHNDSRENAIGGAIIGGELVNLGVGAALVARGAAKGAGIVANDGTAITGITRHAVDRVIGDGAKRAGTKPDAILDAVKNPAKIKEGVDNLGRPFKVYTGENARVVINPKTGKIVSANPLSREGAHMP